MSKIIGYEKDITNPYFEKGLLVYRNSRPEKTSGNPYTFKGYAIGDMRDNIRGVNKDISHHISSKQYEVEGIEYRVYQPSQVDTTTPCLFYIHGGGFVGGSIDVVENACKYMSESANSIVVNIGYRLAPKYAYPQQIDDCLQVINLVIQNKEIIFNRTNLYIAGDSAGANLALACLQKDYDTLSYQRFTEGFIYYPVVDISNTQAFWQWDENAFRGYANDLVKYCCETLKDLEEMLSPLYVQGNEQVKHPYLSPIYREDYSCFPKLTVFYAEYDYLRLQNEAFINRLQQQNHPIESYFFQGVNHGFLDAIGIAPQSKQSIDIIAQSIRGRKVDEF